METSEAKCRISGETFQITAEDKAYYEKIGVPLPTLCPTERQKNRIRFRNFRTFYKKTSDLDKKPILSTYDPKNGYKVYSREEWWSDKWDAMDYARDYNPSKSFFEQWYALNKAVPKLALLGYLSENCDYCNFAFKSRNCYLVFGCVENEDCLFGHIVWQSHNCLDCLYVYRSHWCYECVDCVGCYNAQYSQECDNSAEIYFCYDCNGCRNCFGCVGLRNKQWYWLNEYVGEKKFREKILEIFPLSHKKNQEYLNLVKPLKETALYPEYYGSNIENVSGNHIYFSKNTLESFDAKECEDCKFIYTGQYYKNSYDISFMPGRGELLYQCLAVGSSGGCDRNFFCYDCLDCSNIYYCDNCHNCKDCFGCSGLRQKQYCILNKQYSKEEYEALMPKIIDAMKKSGEFGEFFPHEMSPFAYNESVVQEYHPLTKEEAEKQGYKWIEKVDEPLDAAHISDVPETIDKVDDSIIGKSITCSKSGRKFLITPQEFKFYKQFGLPIPTLHPDERHFNRMSLRNPRILWERNCAITSKRIMTSFLPERTEKVCAYDEYVKQIN